MPIGAPYPNDEFNMPMYPLAQINFAQVPALTGMPCSGYLQFYISAGEMYGSDLQEPDSQKNFRVLFFEETDVKNPKTDFSFLAATMLSPYLPMNKGYALDFLLKYDYVGIGDINGDGGNGFSLNDSIQQYPELELQLQETAYQIFQSAGHKLGGYAYFTQSDPRGIHNKFFDYILLLQIDTDKTDGNDIMWGDGGVANFFIHPADLAIKDFSKVMFSWDCY